MARCFQCVRYIVFTIRSLEPIDNTSAIPSRPCPQNVVVAFGYVKEICVRWKKWLNVIKYAKNRHSISRQQCVFPASLYVDQHQFLRPCRSGFRNPFNKRQWFVFLENYRRCVGWNTTSLGSNDYRGYVYAVRTHFVSSRSDTLYIDFVLRYFHCRGWPVWYDHVLSVHECHKLHIPPLWWHFAALDTWYFGLLSKWS